MSIRFKTLIVLGTLSCATMFAQRMEETNAAFSYNGTWTPTNDANASGGSYTISSTAGSTITFKTTGKNFVIYRKVDTTGGSASVTVDGNDFGSILFYFQETRWQVPSAFDNLPDGPHTVVLTVSATTPAGSGGLNVYFDALDNPASPTLGPTQSQSDAVTRTNFYRALMGIPLASHNLALGLAADAHAKYLSNVDFISNGISPHIETFGKDPAFTGAAPTDRDAYFGSSGFGGTEDSNNSSDPIQFVDGWMDGVYHRGPFISYSLTEIGFGGYAKGSTMDFGSNRPSPARPAAPTVVTYPADGQTDMWTSYGGGDGPTYVSRGNTYGYPISLLVAYPGNATRGTTPAAPTTGTLSDAAGNAVLVTITDSTTDGSVPGYLMIPNQALAPATTYTARMTGVDQLGNAFDKTWKFTTANSNSVHALRAVLPDTSYIYSFNWETPAAGSTAQVEFGPTTAYGTTVPATVASGNLTAYRTRIAGMLTAPVIHFRVTSKDPQGNVYQTVDRTINTANPLAPATVGFITVRPDKDATSFRFQTAGPVVSAVIKYGADTTYGTQLAGTLFGGSTTEFYADAMVLTSGETYNYQIVATDAQGNTYSSPNATFTIP